MDSERARPSPDAAAEASRWLAEYGDMMFAYALRRLGDRGDAEDAVQEALLAGISGWKGFQGGSTERTWLIGILRHKVLDCLRRRTRGGGLVAWAERGATEGDAPSRTPRGLDGLEGEELRRAVVRVVDGLASPYREVVALRLIDGVPAQEVCDILGITPTNLWTLVHRAKQKLREGLASWACEREEYGAS